MNRKNGPTTVKDKNGRFAEGNPGRPRGSRHKTTQAVLALLDGEAEQLTRRAIDAALGGDNMALRLCLERIAPPRKDAPVLFELPSMKTAGDAARASVSILEAVALGELTPAEGAGIMAMVESCRKALETSELEARIQALEELQ